MQLGGVSRHEHTPKQACVVFDAIHKKIEP